MLAFIEESRRFEESHEAALGGAGLSIEVAPPTPRADIAAAEARLGFALPEEHRSLLEVAGPFSIEDSAIVPAPKLKVAYAAMVEDLESDRARLDRVLSEKTRALYRSAVLLYTQVGDGYGGVLYKPAEESCSGSPAYYWWHQDSIDRPALLKSRSGTCRDYASALLWVLAQDSLSKLEDTEADVAVVDRSGRTPQRLLLTHEFEGFVFRLRPDWESFE